MVRFEHWLLVCRLAQKAYAEEPEKEEDLDKQLDRVFDCKQRKCGADEILMKNPSYQHKVKGCPRMANDILGGLGGGAGQGPMPNEDCVAREICYQTCGKTSQECDMQWNEAQKKHCGKNQQMCRLGLMLAANIRVPEKNILECDVYEKNQKEGCVCVKKEDKENHIIKAVEALYEQSPKLSKEKLVDGKLSEDSQKAILEKWKDNPTGLFYALPMKYWKNNKIIQREAKKDPSADFEKHKLSREAAERRAKDEEESSDEQKRKKTEL